MNILKLSVLVVLLASTLFGDVYYARVEPYEVRKISSNVMGVVLYTDEDMIGERLSKKPYIKIDAVLDKEELRVTQAKLAIIEDTLKVNTEVLKNLEASLVKKRVNYERVKELNIKSSVEKDREFYELVASENSYLATLKEVNTLKSQKEDLKLREAQLERSIHDKYLVAEDFTLYSIDVKVGQVVSKGTPLATLMNTKKALLTIYLSASDLQDAKKRAIYIDGEKSRLKIDRVLNIADSKNISKYKAQIIMDAPKTFSKLVKVELRDE